MATSGTFAFKLTVDEMIVEAIERCGKDAQNLEGYVAESAVRSFNLLFADWSTRQIRYWCTEEVILPLQQSIDSYTLDASTLGILTAVLRRDGKDLPLTALSMTEYNEKPDKTTEGRPTEYFFNRQINPELVVWPVPENSTDSIIYWRLRQNQDIVSLGEDVDAPVRWTEAICAGLAAKMAIKLNPDKFPLLKSEAMEAFNNAIGDEGERSSLQLRPRAIVRRR